MAGEFIATLGDASQFDGLVKGPFIKGRREPRIAMVGRSNVGKSSLINEMLGNRSLARVSNQPGKTRQIHFYLWKEASKLVADLPGYGYAKTGHEERDRWAEFINQYLRRDENLERAVVLLDSRHGPTELDIQAIRFMSLESIPVTFVLTKTDQLKTQAERARRKKEVSETLLKIGFDPSTAFWVSSKTKDGLKALQTELISGTIAKTVHKEV
jgi:GTP-binding protein